METDLNQCPKFGSLHDALKYIIDYGESNRRNRWNSSVPLMQVINKKIPEILKNNLVQIDSSYTNVRIIGKSGSSGTWNHVMYVSLMDESSLRFGKYSTSYGIFPALLVSSDCQRIYLVYMLGIGTKSERELKKMCNYIKSQTEFKKFHIESAMNLVNDNHNYNAATLAFIEYSKSYLPDDQTLFKDIVDFIEIHRTVKEHAYPEALRAYSNGLL